MRTIAGILCFFLFMYMLTFVHLTSDCRSTILMAPGTQSFNALNMYSPWWLLVPSLLGIYFLLTGEIDYFCAKRKKANKEK